jgi:site-specific DNA-methyltransferase (adenine-specific)
VTYKIPTAPRAKSQEWSTPFWLFDLLDGEFNFSVDAAASVKNAQIDRYWTEEINGLAQDWTGERVFVNPPWLVGPLNAWTEKAFEETQNGCPVVAMVVPVKSDQKWWNRYAIQTEIRFIQGRVIFGEAKSPSPIPAAVLIFGQDYRACMKSIDQKKYR